jgi:Cd2+/Zn2+-exporting ATPase
MSDSCCHEECHPAKTPASRVLRDGARLSRLVASGGTICAGLIAAAAGHPAISVGSYAVAAGVAIVTPAGRAVRSIRARILDINVLMVIAAIGAAALHDWLEAAVVLWLFSVAQWLEALSMDRARRAIRSLVALAPATALVRRGGAERVVDVASVLPGEIVVVRPGERVPIDGTVVRGTSAVNQAPVTGESVPADKEPGDKVFAGSINGMGAIDVEALRQAADSTIAQIARLVEEAQTRRAPIQTFVDRFARRYTPAVVALAVVVAVVPPLFAGGSAGAFSVWVYRALTLIVVACPCALVISTPVSIISALTAAAREGVLIKGGAHLERLASVRCVAFDKTGTLTHGRVRVTDVFGVDGASDFGVLSVAAALESRSEHPIGRAIVSRALAHGLQIAPGEGYRALPGLGAEAQVAELPAIIGNHRLFEERQLCTASLHDRLDHVTGRGGTAVLVGHDGSALGVIGLSDEMRLGGPEAIDQLRAQGVRRVVLLSGDTQRNTDAAMASSGVDEAHADLMPAEKAEWVARLREQYGPVAMVGDGINDAPALAAADVGIAMGVAGTDVAIETADVALMSDDLNNVPFALRLGRLSLNNIRVNVGIALGLKVAFVAMAAMGIATLWMAIVADTGASLLVTANGLRLLAARR